MTTKDEIERLKTQRSRFIAFAFAGNDVLIELDADQVICYCAGTVEPVMGCDPEALKRVPITDLIAERDASAFNEMMLRLRRTGRLDHIPLHFNTPGGTERRLTLSAIRLPETPESTYLALSLLRGRDAREPEEDINKLGLGSGIRRACV